MLTYTDETGVGEDEETHVWSEGAGALNFLQHLIIQEPST